MVIAMKLKFLPGFEGHYVIGVSGIPVISGHSEGERGDSYDGLKDVTHLEVKGQQPARTRNHPTGPERYIDRLVRIPPPVPRSLSGQNSGIQDQYWTIRNQSQIQSEADEL